LTAFWPRVYSRRDAGSPPLNIDSNRNLLSHPDLRESPFVALGWLAICLIGIYLLIGPQIELHAWQVIPQTNASLDEALQWKKGKLNVNMKYEMSHYGDKYYNVAGLAFTMISVVATTINNLAGGRPDDFFPLHYIMVVAVPIPIASFWAFRRVTGSSPYAALFTTYLFVGTSLEPILRVCRNGSLNFIDHALAVTGLLIFAGDLLGRPRIWPAALGLMLASWSRPMTSLLTFPFLLIVWQLKPVLETRMPLAAARRRMILALAAVVIIWLVPCSLSYAKYGNPFDSGFSRIYENRKDAYGMRGTMAIFSLRYIPLHLEAMTSFPSWDVRGGSLYPLTDGREGGSPFLTSPLLFAIFIMIRKWWGDSTRRILMAGTLLIIAGEFIYHTTGSFESGHYRYALDYIPIWLLVVAPYLCTRRALPWILACLAFSGLYFRVLG
jgi:hypothetical protein